MGIKLTTTLVFIGATVITGGNFILGALFAFGFYHGYKRKTITHEEQVMEANK